MFEKLNEICAAQTDNLAELAEIAAPGDAAFFDGAQFEGADLRGTDLSAFYLDGANFRGARIDEGTVIPRNLSPSTYQTTEVYRQTRETLLVISDVLEQRIAPSLEELIRKLGGDSRNDRRRKTRQNYQPPPEKSSRKQMQIASLQRIRSLNSSIKVRIRDIDPLLSSDMERLFSDLLTIFEICSRFSPGEQEILAKNYGNSLSPIETAPSSTSRSGQSPFGLNTNPPQSANINLVAISNNMNSIITTERPALMPPSIDIDAYYKFLFTALRVSYTGEQYWRELRDEYGSLLKILNYRLTDVRVHKSSTTY